MKRMRKFGPRYGLKKFEEGGPTVGGPTSYADSGSAGGTNISFKEAFRAARKQGLETFTWRGETYHTELASDKPKKSEEKKSEEAPVNFATQGRKPTVDFAKEGRVKPKAPEVGEPTQAMRDEARYKVRSQEAPGRPGGPGVRRRNVEAERSRSALDKVTDFIRNTRMVGGAPDYMKDESGRIRNPSRDEGMRGGGRVKKYAGGGSVKSSASRRADGIAQRGKTRGKMI